jgi:hypothetical protein
MPVYSDEQIDELFVERVGMKINDANLDELEATRQAYFECKSRCGRVTEKVKVEWKEVLDEHVAQMQLEFQEAK